MRAVGKVAFAMGVVTIPVSIRAGWHYGTPQFRNTIQLTIEYARFW